MIDRKRTAFVMVDVQEKFAPAIHGFRDMVKNAAILARAARILSIPLIATEQYPKGLGRTVPEAGLDGTVRPIEKMHFSCFGSDEFVSRLEGTGAGTLVIFGIETHVCVLQTALDAVERGMKAIVAADAVSSRKREDRDIALDRMRQGGVIVESSEAVLFQLVGKAGTGEFRRISELVR